ncbi:antitoxin of toxin-antitoxin stability system [Citrobacter amalonaticus]|uniref:antitoxin of toxin-antitoxin stability system n=1 Tax=Citrobacter amalonaticus TaxID=35703 RepID=UPI001A29DE0B|nr:antitoxin of toxin-antitoxin stability system [Citrobacter amalonaticus]HDQ2811417.1 antitoxin of toxin-antitoxin stability system [Citrobacter amalonaticus]
MVTKAVFTMKLEPELRDSFMAEVAAEDRPAAQVIRELMRGYIEQRKKLRDHNAYLQSKVDVARQSAQAGRGRTNDEIEASFALRRAQVSKGRSGL